MNPEKFRPLSSDEYDKLEGNEPGFHEAARRGLLDSWEETLQEIEDVADRILPSSERTRGEKEKMRERKKYYRDIRETIKTEQEEIDKLLVELRGFTERLPETKEKISKLSTSEWEQKIEPLVKKLSELRDDRATYLRLFEKYYKPDDDEMVATSEIALNSFLEALRETILTLKTISTILSDLEK